VTGFTTGLGAGFTAGLATGFGNGFGTGLGFAGTVTVFVIVCVVVEPAEDFEDLTQTVTEPDPIFEP
jgi:hypothetical protein